MTFLILLTMKIYLNCNNGLEFREHDGADALER